MLKAKGIDMSRIYSILAPPPKPEIVAVECMDPTVICAKMIYYGGATTDTFNP